MNVFQLAEDFRLVSVDWAAANVVAQRPAQEDAKLEAPAYPALLWEATLEPCDADGRVGRFTVTATLKAHAQDATPEATADTANDFQHFLHGQKATIIADIYDLGRFRVIGYTAAADAVLLDGNTFAVPVIISGTVQEL